MRTWARLGTRVSGDRVTREAPVTFPTRTGTFRTVRDLTPQTRPPFYKPWPQSPLLVPFPLFPCRSPPDLTLLLPLPRQHLQHRPGGAWAGPGWRAAPSPGQRMPAVVPGGRDRWLLSRASACPVTAPALPQVCPLSELPASGTAGAGGSGRGSGPDPPRGDGAAKPRAGPVRGLELPVPLQHHVR